MLNRKEAISIIVENIKNEPIVAANGYISRDLFEECDRVENFYMIGSMGLASSIGLGIALKNKKRVFIFDGDGNILMNLGSLTTIGKIKPQNLVHVIFDNSSHESTGGQPTNTTSIEIDKIARSANYRVFKTNNKKCLKKIIKKIEKYSGPIMILIKIKNSKKISKRISINTEKIQYRFISSLKS